jgi:hypothetical protein
MKGILNKTEQGWVVVHDQRTWQDPSTEDGVLPLHPTDNTLCNQYADYSVFVGKQVEFEIMRYCEKHNSDPSKNSVCTLDCGYEEVRYAKLSNHIVDTTKMVADHIVEPNEMIDQNLKKLKQNLERLDYYQLGYKTAKQKLFTSEEMIEWTMAMIAQYACGNTGIWNRELLKESLPKK